MRILFCGMPGRYAPPHLAALLAAGLSVVGVAVPAPPGAPPVTRLPPLHRPPATLLGPPPGLLELAGAAGLPVIALRTMRHPAIAAELRTYALDLVCVACWPWRIPPELLALPRLGWLNSHPSRLPALRGSDPLAAALALGLQRTGVTIHWMDADLDTGPIVAQADLDLPPGSDYASAETRAAALAAHLLTTVVGAL
jgi:methionyl-tRNA formyltransferase